MKDHSHLHQAVPSYQTPEPVAAERALPAFRESFKADFLASIVVFLVALPLCMGIALASGAPPASGLITGIIAGLVVGMLAGSPLQVSGPAAGLSVVVFDMITRYRTEYLVANGVADPATLQPDNPLYLLGTEHALYALGAITLLAGLIQLTAGVLRWGQWFRAVSPAVIQGMLAGIGVLIFASQFHVMIDDAPRGSGLANLLSIPEAIWKAVFPNGPDTTVHRQAALIGVLTILILISWKFVAPQRLKFLPAPLVGVVLVTALVATLGLGIRHVEMPGNLLDAVRVPSVERFGDLWSWSLLGAAVMLAAIASAETLLCATAVDKLHQGPRTRYDRELAAQGIGNTLCGLVGGLPMTGVIVRSAANVEAGAKTRLSAIMHGAWLLGFVALAPFVLELIPTASLAAVLVFTGYKLMNVQAIRTLAGYGKGELFIYGATVFCIVAIDLLTGVLVGIGLSAAKLLYTFTHLSVRVERDPGVNRAVMHLRGAATFLRLPKLAAALETIPANTELHVDFDQLDFIDHACLDLLMNWERQHQATGGKLVLDWDGLTARFRPSRRRAKAHAQPTEASGAVPVSAAAAPSSAE